MLAVMQNIHAHITVTFGIKISNFRGTYYVPQTATPGWIF